MSAQNSSITLTQQWKVVNIDIIPTQFAYVVYCNMCAKLGWNFACWQVSRRIQEIIKIVSVQGNERSGSNDERVCARLI